MRLILALAAGAIGYFYYRGKAVAARRVGAREDLSRWEGEGGNPVPPIPSPSPYPNADPGLRH